MAVLQALRRRTSGARERMKFGANIRRRKDEESGRFKV
jgi:hypothetical protein